MRCSGLATRLRLRFGGCSPLSFALEVIIKMFPKWLNIQLNWEQILEKRNIEGFFDNIPIEYKSGQVDAYKRFYEKLKKQIQTETVYLDPSFDLSDIRIVGEKNPEVAAKMAEFQAMLMVKSKSWNYAHPYLVEAYKQYRRCGEFGRANDLFKIIQWSKIEFKLLLAKHNNKDILSKVRLYGESIFMKFVGVTSYWGVGFGRLLMSIIIVVLFASVLNYLIFQYDHCAFKVETNQMSFFSSLYYTIVSMTTLGYGDIVPVKFLAKFVAILQVLVGFFFFGSLVAIFLEKNKIE